MKGLLGRRVAVAFVVVAAIAVAGIAYASIPDANGVIHGCYNSDNGALRVFGKSKDLQQCNAGEKPLDWSQTGTTGPTGATGPSGPSGVPGLAINSTTTAFVGPSTGAHGFICADSSKIAIGATAFDKTNPLNFTLHGSANQGVLGGGAPDGGWTIYFTLGSTTPTGDMIVFSIECANPPVGS